MGKNIEKATEMRKVIYIWNRSSRLFFLVGIGFGMLLGIALCIFWKVMGLF